LALLTATAAVRPAIYDLNLGSEAAPVSQAARYTLNRTTAIGTTTALTPQALDPSDPAATATAGQQAITGEPTYTAGAIVLQFALNQQATFRWVCAPGSPLLTPATAGSGIGLRAAVVSAAYVVSPNIFFAE
jgi:hypothetical protein